MKILFILALTLALPAYADPVTWHFSGAVETVSNFDVPQFTVTPGSRFLVTVTLDSGATDDVPETDIGRYRASQFRFVANDQEITKNAGLIHVWVGDSQFADQPDSLAVTSGGGAMTAPWGPVWGGFDLVLNDPTRTVFYSDALPVALDMSQWSGGYLDLWGGEAQNLYQLRGNITTITAVPEPGITTLLLLTAFVGLWHMRHRLKKVGGSEPKASGQTSTGGERGIRTPGTF